MLHGAFSIALWDENAKRLLLAIDRLGIKSMYWRKEGQRLMLASHAGAIHAVQDAAPEVNPSAIAQYLVFSVVPAPITIYRGTHKLRPGFQLMFEGGEVKERQYWDLHYDEERGRSESYWAQELQTQMRSAVHRHLDGCGAENTGAYLSGGTDSSSVVAFMSERFTPAKSFSIAFQEAPFSEIEYARTTAKRFQTSHHEQFLSPEDARAAIPKVMDYYQEPFANSSAIASYRCALLARQNGVDTLLAGDGGDELFGGNERYASDKRFGLYHSVPKWIRKGFIEPMASLLPSNENSKWSLPRRYIRRANLPNPLRILSYNLFLGAESRGIFEAGFLEQAAPEQWLAIASDHFESAHASSELNRLLYMDVKITLADNDLRKVNGTAELAGVRVRYPLLDHQLAEFSGRIPSRLKLKGFKKRYIFKQAMTGILPERVLYKTKHGFGVPLSLWLLQDPELSSLVQDVLRDSRTRQRGYFRPEFIDRLSNLHRTDHALFYGEAVWYLLALELWHRQHLECSERIARAR